MLPIIGFLIFAGVMIRRNAKYGPEVAVNMFLIMLCCLAVLMFSQCLLGWLVTNEWKLQSSVELELVVVGDHQFYAQTVTGHSCKSYEYFEVGEDDPKYVCSPEFVEAEEPARLETYSASRSPMLYLFVIALPTNRYEIKVPDLALISGD